VAHPKSSCAEPEDREAVRACGISVGVLRADEVIDRRGYVG
jgi:hypothetical protein